MEGEDRDAAFNGCCKSRRKHIQSIKGKVRPIPGGWACRPGGARVGAVGISRAQLGQGRMKRFFQTNELNVAVCHTLVFNPGVKKCLPVKSGFLLALHKTQPPGCLWKVPAWFLWV